MPECRTDQRKFALLLIIMVSIESLLIITTMMKEHRAAEHLAAIKRSRRMKERWLLKKKDRKGKNGMYIKNPKFRDLVAKEQSVLLHKVITSIGKQPPPSNTDGQNGIRILSDEQNSQLDNDHQNLYLDHIDTDMNGKEIEDFDHAQVEGKFHELDTLDAHKNFLGGNGLFNFPLSHDKVRKFRLKDDGL